MTGNIALDEPDITRERRSPDLRLDATWENGVEHSGSRCFADMEEVTGATLSRPPSRL
jgi:hypothetical protein